jgi:hypothetical protein
MEELDFVKDVYSQNLTVLIIADNAIGVFLRWITTVHG